MAKRTLASCWKQYEKLAKDFYSSRQDTAEAGAKLQALTEKTNADGIADSTLTPLFVRPYIAVPLTVEFNMELENGVEVPKWITRFDGEKNVIYVHPLAFFRFVDEIRHYKREELQSDDILHFRYIAFLMEIAKMPPIYILFLCVLQRVAFLLEVAHLEKRGGVIEVAEGENYHTMLWAFKELENFSRRTYGLNIRAHFGISWYEADWITGR